MNIFNLINVEESNTNLQACKYLIMNSLRRPSDIAVKNRKHINFEHPNALVINKKEAGILLFRRPICMCTA